MTTNIVALVAATQATLLAALVKEVTPERGQFMADLTDREILAWSALCIMAEQRGGHVRSRHFLRAAALFSLSERETLVIANVLRNTAIEQRSQS